MAALVQARVTEIREGGFTATALGSNKPIDLKVSNYLEAKTTNGGIKLAPAPAVCQTRTSYIGFKPVTALVQAPVLPGMLILCEVDPMGKSTGRWLPKAEFIQAADLYKTTLARKQRSDQTTYRLVTMTGGQVRQQHWMATDPYDPTLAWLLSRGPYQLPKQEEAGRLEFQRYNPKSFAWEEAEEPDYIFEPIVRKEGSWTRT